MKKEIYKERVEIKLSPKQKEKLQRMADGQDLTMNQVVRNLIEEKNIKYLTN